jgi:hypothetical protein
LRPQRPWFDTAEYDPSVIEDEGARAFVEDLRLKGYAEIDLGPEALSLCDQAIAETEPLFEAGRFRRLQDAWRRSPAVKKLALLPIVKERLALAYGRPSFAFQTLNFRQGSEQAPHSDTIHFNAFPEGFMCGVWIALEDVHADAGPLLYYERSHRLSRLTMRDVGVARRATENDYPAFEACYGNRLAESNLSRSFAIIPKGHAFVWSANLAHGGSPISREGSTRRSLVVHHYFRDCLYFTPLMSDEATGQLCVRVPADIETGGVRWPKRNGRPVAPSPKSLAGSLISIMTKRVPRF